MKTTIIGTHGVGKTTYAYYLAAQSKHGGANTKIINETARSCPYPLNDRFSREGALWIYHTHIKKELEAIRNFDVVICDRSALDSLLYAIVAGFDFEKHPDLENALHGAEEWMYTYSRIIYVRSSGFTITKDKQRSVDLSFQQKVQLEFDDWVNAHLNLPIEIFDSTQVFDEIKRGIS